MREPAFQEIVAEVGKLPLWICSLDSRFKCFHSIPVISTVYACIADVFQVISVNSYVTETDHSSATVCQFCGGKYHSILESITGYSRIEETADSNLDITFRIALRAGLSWLYHSYHKPRHTRSQESDTLGLG